jgi:hypothetical protein
MTSEPHSDPRERPLPPTQEEIDAWAVREHRRRAAWLAGPSEEEKQDWARRYRWRAVFGLEESRLGPAPEDIELWAAREHRRREAWLAGPTEAEQQSWARQQRRRARIGLADASAPPPAQAEIDAWAAREKQRRQEWLAGPSEGEKQQWAERQTRRLVDELTSLPAMLETDFPEAVQRLLRDAELAGKGTVYTLSRAPLMLWSYFIRAGRAFEGESSKQPPRSRVPY